MKNRIALLGPLASVIVTLGFCILVLFVYVPKTLQGDFNKHFLPSEMFGITAELRNHGLTALYSKLESGWDGQFYYSISNDIFAQKDTPQHLDAAAYRYQRVGLPLLANLISKVTFQSWVSPATYYLTSLLLVLLATFMAARYFQANGVSSLWSLVWSLGFGTQVTMLNGLPDAAADAMLIIALVSLLQGKRWLYAVAVTLAALSREVYVLMPAVIAAVEFLVMIKGRIGREQLLKLLLAGLQQAAWHLPALVAVISWQLYLRVRFGVSPSSEAAGILGLPFVTTYQYLVMGFAGNHPLMGSPGASHKEATVLLLYVILLIYSLVQTVAMMRQLIRGKRFTDLTLPEACIAGVLLVFLAIIALYTAFGPTVVMHHTGYLKAGNIFLFVLPFLAATSGRPMRTADKGGLIIFTLLVSIPLLWNRIDSHPSYSNYTTPAKVEFAQTQPECVLNPRAVVELMPGKPQSVLKDNIFTRLTGTQASLYWLNIRNTSDMTYYPYQGKGSVNISYQWLQDDKVVKDGVRSFLTGPLKPSAETIRPVVVEFPHKAGDYVLKFTLVQEGCFWFYRRSPVTSYDLHLSIK
jgi:hypothetical protein